MARSSFLFPSLWRRRKLERSEARLNRRPLRPQLESLERRDLLASFTTLEDMALVVSDPNLVHAGLIAGPAHGKVSFSDAGGFTYTPAENYNGQDAFVYGFANSAGGTTLTGNETAAITVQSVNDAPSGADMSRQVSPNAAYTFQASDFGFIDPKDNPPNSFLAVKIVTLPAVGQLVSGNVPVSAGQAIPIVDVQLGLLKYIPDPTNTTATNGASFTFAVQDNGGVANGGVDADQTPNKLTIYVAPVVQPPKLTANPNSYVAAQNGTLTIGAPGVLGNDTKSGDGIVAGSWAARLKNGASHGTVTLNTDGSFTYQPAADYTGLDTFTYYDTATYVPPSTNGAVSDPITIVSNTVTVTLLVRSPAPFVFAQNDTFLATPNAPLAIAAPGVLKNDVVYTSDVTNTTPAPAAVLNVPLQAALVTDVAHGTLTLAADGSFSYVPAKDFTGTDTFTYRASVAPTGAGTPASNPDSHDVATVSIFVFAPQATNDVYSTPQDAQLTVAAPGVLGNDQPADGHAISATLITNTLHGALSLNADGSFTYKPASGFFGTDSFVYRAVDSSAAAAGDPLDASNLTASQVLELINHGYNGLAVVTIHVEPVTPKVIANNDTYVAATNVALDVAAPGVLKNDYLILGDPTTGSSTTNTSPVAGYPLMAVLVAQPTNGTLELHSDGSFHYVPKTDFSGADTFTYQAVLNASASAGADPITATSALATVTINVAPIAPSPVAFDDSYSTAAGTQLTIPAPGVTGNDTKANGATLLAVIGSRPSNGNIEFHSDGSFSYTPASGFTGTDTFTYQDLELLGSPAPPPDDPNHYISNFATVTINVKAVVTAPVAVNDEFHINQGTPLIADPPGVLANDKAPPGDKLSAVLNSDVSNGTLNLTASGGFSYTPAAGFSGVDSFTYYDIDTSATNSDATTSVKSNVATVKIYVQSTTVKVYALDDTYGVAENGSLSIDKPGVLANDTTVPPPLLGATPDANGNLSGQPGSPIANLPLMATLLTGTQSGDLTLNADGSFSYKPHGNFVGADTFTYRASVVTSTPPGGGGDPTTNTTATSNFVCPQNAICATPPDDVATVTIYVKPPPGPVAVNDFYLTAENTALGIGMPGVLTNDYIRPAPAQPGATPNTGSPIMIPLTAVLVAGPTNGTLALNGDGSFKYTPNGDFVGIDTFTYQDSEVTPTAGGTATDSAPILSNIATVSIRVVAAVAHNDNYATDVNTALDVIAPGVLGNDAGGSAAHPLMSTLLAGPMHGTLKLNADGSFDYQPATGYSGPDMFSYRASDGTTTTSPTTTNSTAVDPATGTVLATAVSGDANRPINAYDIGVVKIYVRPPAPTIQAHDDKYLTPENTTLTIGAPGVLANDYGPVNVPVIAALVDKPTHGTVTLGEKGDFIYTPEADFSGEDKFTYSASVAAAAGSTTSAIKSGLATVVIYVAAPNTTPSVIIGGDQTTTDESGPQQVTDYAAVVAVDSDGAPPAINVSTDKPNLFSTPPSIDPTGQLIYTPAPNASGTATITVTTGGDPTTGEESDSQTFTIHIDKPHAFTNTADPCDVTDDNTVAADDVLSVINYINAHGSSPVSQAPTNLVKHLYYDVDKDDVIAAIDVLLVINYINAHHSAPATDANIDSSLLTLVAQDTADATIGKKKT